MEHPFKVGELYQNRLGFYEVTYLDEAHDKMLIRYIDSGEEVDATITHQERIWQNMSWENEEEVRLKAKEEARYQHGYGLDFAGLADSDFKTNTKGTSWRSRRGLAGKVAGLLTPNSGYTFVSWDIYRWPVAFLTHREDYYMAAFKLGTCKAKFTIELDEMNAYYGLYVEGDIGALDNNWDWTRILPRLRERNNLQEAINAAEVEHGVRFIGRSSPGGETFHFADGLAKSAESLWDEEDPSIFTVMERLGHLEKIPRDRWGELYLLATMPKQ